MKINITKIEEVDIDTMQMKEIALKYLEERYQLHRDMWILENNLMEEVKYITSKVCYNDELVRPATDIDKAVLETIKNIYKEG